jgi:hypothetical protein
MKLLHIVLILLTILSVFSRRHHRSRSSGIFDGITNWISDKFSSNKSLIKKISEKIDATGEPNCTEFTDVNGKNLKKLFPNSKFSDSCKLNCEGWDQSTPFKLFVDYAKQGTTAQEKVDRLITVFGEKVWAWKDCQQNSGRRRKFFK